MGVAVDGLCPPSAGLQRNQWCTFSRPVLVALFVVSSKNISCKGYASHSFYSIIFS